jgi:succinate dehydrogenase/fumarate reductase flavoprotein subunit
MPERELSQTTDLVIVGFGAAGAAAAISAADLGASVTLIEKQELGQHTPSTAMSAGVIMAVGDVALATTYLDRCASGRVPLSVTSAWAAAAHELPDWLDGVGLDLRLQRVQGGEHPDFPGAAAIDVMRSARTADGQAIELERGSVSSLLDVASMASGVQLFNSLRIAVERRPNIKVIWGRPAGRLTSDADGAVTGVKLSTRDGSVVEGRYGTVLATGGYEFGEDLKINYLQESPWHFYGNPGNTGDGIRMAQAVGADLWHMGQVSGRAVAHFVDDDGTPINLRTNFGPEGHVVVDRSGRRFANEELATTHYFSRYLSEVDPVLHDYPRIPCYWIFDSKRIARPLVVTNRGMALFAGYQWSSDNKREIDRGWVSKGASVSEAAANAGVEDASEAATTVREYNATLAKGGADPFGRRLESRWPIDTPPFYCLRLYPGGSHTSGGPRRDQNAHVLSCFGDPIPRLFAAGELGQAIGPIVPSPGCNLSEALCFGRIAALAALSQ